MAAVPIEFCSCEVNGGPCRSFSTKINKISTNGGLFLLHFQCGTLPAVSFPQVLPLREREQFSRAPPVKTGTSGGSWDVQTGSWNWEGLSACSAEGLYIFLQTYRVLLMKAK